jgi:Zn finger protein HypA/HybF involved in hydrogenase expression
MAHAMGRETGMDITQGLTDIRGALGALQSASNIIKTLAGLRSEGERSTKLIELQSQIVAAQASAIQANLAQSNLIDRVHQLEAQIAQMEAWSAEKQRYELKAISTGAFAYALKTDASGTEPAHYICQPCYEKGKKRILQFNPSAMVDVGIPHTLKCPECKAEIVR